MGVGKGRAGSGEQVGVEEMMHLGCVSLLETMTMLCIVCIIM